MVASRHDPVPGSVLPVTGGDLWRSVRPPFERLPNVAHHEDDEDDASFHPGTARHGRVLEKSRSVNRRESPCEGRQWPRGLALKQSAAHSRLRDLHVDVSGWRRWERDTARPERRLTDCSERLSSHCMTHAQQKQSFYTHCARFV
ncbi:unnamed protein product [Lampetra fluviatilis]